MVEWYPRLLWILSRPSTARASGCWKQRSRCHSGPVGSNQPTQPLRPEGQPTPAIPASRRCRGGHDQPRNPTWHPTLGLVPALSSVVVAVIVIVGVIALEASLWSQAIPWTIALLAVGLMFSATTQLLLGHRGMCFVWRTLRWWLGPIGSLLDPIEMG